MPCGKSWYGIDLKRIQDFTNKNKHTEIQKNRDLTIKYHDKMNLLPALHKPLIAMRRCIGKSCPSSVSDYKLNIQLCTQYYYTVTLAAISFHTLGHSTACNHLSLDPAAAFMVARSCSVQFCLGLPTRLTNADVSGWSVSP